MYAMQNQENAVVFQDGNQRLRVAFVNAAIARITCTEGREFSDAPSQIVIAPANFAGFKAQVRNDDFLITTAELQIEISKATGAICYRDAQGRVLLQEPVQGGRWLASKQVHRNVYQSGARVALGRNIDGARASVDEFTSVFDRDAFEAKLEFEFAENEALFGLGSHEEGNGNLRGKYVQLYQQNMKAVVPHLVSTKGYGILLDCGSLMTFHDDAQGSYLWAEVVDELDFYFIFGRTFDGVTRRYYELTGPVPLPPKWAFGYAQSKERYFNAREMIAVVEEYRRRKIPLDLIVLDWKSWPNGSGWGQKTLDPVRFPDPPEFTEKLHELGARLMVSIWPIMTGDCPDQIELREQGMMLGNQATYDAFQEKARRAYWEQARRGLFAQGVDAWWCDCTEPFEADWSGAVKPETHQRVLINSSQSKQYLDAGKINLYSLLHSRGIYEGQRQVTQEKRVLNLTRSAYAGQHRYATMTWSGDVCATWETLRRSIPEGVNFCATGEPYWTVDIGGFFIKNDPSLWFWRGDYEAGCRGLAAMDALEPDPIDTGCTDLGYWELYTRWLQYAAFLPMFRSHGTDASREIWRFGDEGNPFYDTIAKFIKLRYRLLPYIYSLAAHVSLRGSSMMKAVALVFPDDLTTHNLTDQFFFGPALMVCPVTKPMYYQRDSVPVNDVPKTRPIYLPESCAWFNFWTEEMHVGGQTISAAAPLEIIPVFVPAGSIVPMSSVMQYVDELPEAPYEIRIYCGADAEFYVYEDEGDTYHYENGAYSFIKLAWFEARNELVISARTGEFDGMVESRQWRLIFISETGRRETEVNYSGLELKLNPSAQNSSGPKKTTSI
jgi:alpha-D-xyloside xylohydrolase